MNKNDHKTNKSVMDNPIIKNLINQQPAKKDPFGSYTGIPIDKNVKPIQDVDDL